MNTYVPGHSFMAFASSGGLEDGELDSEKEQTAPKSRRLHKDFYLNSDKIVREDFPRFSPTFQDVPMRWTDDTTEDDADDYEMLCIRGGSPPKVRERNISYMSTDETNFNDASHFSENDENGDQVRVSRRSTKRRTDRSWNKRRSGRSSRNKDKSDVRENNRKEERYKNNSYTSSHPTEDKSKNRKLEICKFYLMDCCIRRRVCSYMHGEFPCKYFYLGLECENEKPCKYLHGKALNEDMKTALIRHIIAAPRTILGDFKRMPIEKLACILEARNAQLLKEEKGDGIQTFEGKRGDCNNHITNEETMHKGSQNENATYTNLLESIVNQNVTHFPELFTKTQLRALNQSGISRLQQINNLTLAKLSEIGLSVLQINELQEKFERIYKTRLQNSNRFVTAENYPKENDSDIKMVPTVEEKMRELNFGDSDEEQQNVHVEEHISCSESELEEILQPLDELSFSECWDDETNMRTDESTCSESQNQVKEPLSCTEDYQKAQKDGDVSDIANNKETGDDVHMTMPLVPLTDFIPASEIQASISLHPPITYKLIEIHIPKRQYSIDSNTALSYNKLLDPRLRYLQLHNNNSSEEYKLLPYNAATKIDKSKPTATKTSGAYSGSISSDPRKRKANEIINYSTIFNEYLQKSTWYQEQKSHIKIEVNRLLTHLSYALRRFHQNPNVDRCFDLRNVELPNNADEVLCKLGVQIDANGIVCERVIETKPSNARGTSEIPSLLSLNLSNAPANFHKYSPPDIIPPFIPINLPPPPLCFDMPKPGLLGIAPGIEYLPFFPVPPPNPDFSRFQRGVAEHHRSLRNRPPGRPFYHQRPIGGPPFRHSHYYDWRDNRNENRKRGAPFGRRGGLKRFRRF